MSQLLEKFSLEGKKALVVCPENPYGKELVEGLLSAGAEVWLAGDAAACKAFAGLPCIPYEHGSAEAAAQLERDVREQMGVLDVVVENGLWTDRTGWQQSYEAICEELRSTHLGMMLTVQALGHILAEQGHGSVLLIADYGALTGYDPVHYEQSPELWEQDFSLVKGFAAGGVVNYARQASNYLAEQGCRCNAIAFGPLEGSCPDAFRESFVRHSQIKRLLKPEDVAAAAVFLASDASAFITGVTLPVDGGYTAK